MRLTALFVWLGASCLMAQEPVDFAGWMNRGVQEFRSGRYPDAAAAFSRAAAIDPSSLNAHLYLGTAYMQQYIPGAESPANAALADLAVQQFTGVVGQDPANRVALASLGSLALNRKQWDQAQELYEKLTAVDPSNADAYYSMGFIAWSRWYPAYGKARTSLGMKQADPGPMPEGSIKQELKSSHGNVIEGGLRSLQRALEINPNYADAMAYMNLLIRERADLCDTSAEYQQEITVADDWVGKALLAKRRMVESQPARGAVVPPPPPPPSSPVPDLRVSAATAQQFLVRNVQPQYPPLAMQARVQGAVLLDVLIDWRGTVVGIKVISGHPLLVPAAIQAVKQWEYSPAMFNAAAKYVATEVSVNFALEAGVVQK